MGRALASVVERLGGDETVRAVVLTGAGVAFSAGGDLAMIEARAAAGRAAPGEPQRSENRAFMLSFYGLFLSLRELPQPTLAAINGAAIGAGLAVALACDLRIAAREARLGLNFNRLGIHPGMGSTWTLRSEEHTSELQSRENLVCRLLLEKKKNIQPKRPQDGRKKPLTDYPFVALSLCNTRATDMHAGPCRISGIAIDAPAIAGKVFTLVP